MKVFISHSWKDKATADMLTQNLSSMVDVWLDIQNLRPGDSITPSIDRALAEMDLVIVLWSQNSAKSDGVAAEITTALRLKKPVIPCRIDETELDSRIREVLAIEMQDFMVGYPSPFFQVQVKRSISKTLLRQSDHQHARAHECARSDQGQNCRTCHRLHKSTAGP